MQKTYNGYALPGFDSSRPPHKEFRWMIVWDEKGWTVPVRRVIVSFNGKFVDSNGCEWDFASELPAHFMTDRFKAWREVPLKIYKRDPQQYRLHTDPVPYGW